MLSIREEEPQVNNNEQELLFLFEKLKTALIAENSAEITIVNLAKSLFQFLKDNSQEFIYVSNSEVVSTLVDVYIESSYEEIVSIWKSVQSAKSEMELGRIKISANLAVIFDEVVQKRKIILQEKSQPILSEENKEEEVPTLEQEFRRWKVDFIERLVLIDDILVNSNDIGLYQIATVRELYNDSYKEYLEKLDEFSLLLIGGTHVALEKRFERLNKKIEKLEELLDLYELKDKTEAVEKKKDEVGYNPNLDIVAIKSLIERCEPTVLTLAPQFRRNYAIFIEKAEHILWQLLELKKDLENQEYIAWKTSLSEISQFPHLISLNEEINKPLPVRPFGINTPANRIDALVGVYGKVPMAQKEVDDNGYLRGDQEVKQKEYLNIQYFDKAKAKVVLLKQLVDDEANDVEHTAWKAETSVVELKTVVSIINAINEKEISPHSNSPTAKKVTDLEEYNSRLQSAVTAAKHGGFLERSRYSFDKVKEEITNLVGVDNVGGEVSKAEAKIRRLIEYARSDKERKPINELTYGEFIDEMLERSLDPTRNEYGQAATPGREKDLVIAFNKSRDPRERSGASPQEVLENITKKHLLLLRMLDARLFNGNQASCDRKQLFEQVTKAYTLTRKDLLIATTYHNDHGTDVRNILQTIVTESTKASIIIRKLDEFKDQIEANVEGGMSRDDAERDVLGDLMYEYYVDNRKNLFTYNALAGEQGRDHLSKMVEHYFPAMNERTKELAKRCFTVFDVLNLVLQELQSGTMTRGHNNGLDMVDVIGLQNPLAAFVHASERYGGNPKDWRAWILPFFKDLANKKALDEYKDNNPWKVVGATGDSKRLLDITEKIISHQEVYYDTSDLFGQIELPRFCESLFPSTFDLLFLQESEALERPDGTVVNSNADRIANPKGEKITPFELYETSLNGWSKLLEYTYQQISGRLTEDHILVEAKEGEKGLLGLWLSKAGAMKVFPGPLKKLIPVLLTQYIYRLFQHFVGGNEARKVLLVKVVREIEHTKTKGGLSGAYKAALNKVIINLANNEQKMVNGLPRNLVPGVNYRTKQRKEYVDLIWIDEHPPIVVGEEGKPVPTTVGGFSFNLLPDTERAEYLGMINAEPEHPVPLPANRNGSMIQLDEAKKK